jgi:hypothetical protein
MRFLAWFEPERAMRGTWLEREHPDWLLKPTGTPDRLRYQERDGFYLSCEHVLCFLSGCFERNRHIFFFVVQVWLELLRKSHEVDQLVRVYDVRGAVHAAGAELGVAVPLNRKRLLADLA